MVIHHEYLVVEFVDQLFQILEFLVVVEESRVQIGRAHCLVEELLVPGVDFIVFELFLGGDDSLVHGQELVQGQHFPLRLGRRDDVRFLFLELLLRVDLVGGTRCRNRPLVAHNY